MEAINIKAYPEDVSQLKAIKAFMKALKIKFEVSKNETSHYDLEFVKKIQQGDEDMKNGKGKQITIEELEHLCK